MKLILVKWQVFRNRKTNYVGISCNAVKNLRQLFHGHFAAAGTVSHQLRIGEIGGVEQMFIQYVHIKMHQDVVERFREGLDFLLGNEVLRL